MTERATAKANVTSWKEDTYRELEGGQKLTRAAVSQELTGDVEGSTSIDYLMCYAPDGTARFVGQQDISATLAGRSGTFVAHSSGGFESGVASGTWSVVPGSATGGLAGLEGSGTWTTIDQTTMSMTLEYDLH
jgi:hypothetical protein